MSTFEALQYDPYRLGRGFGDGGDGHDYATGHGEGGPASARVIVAYGFWIFLLSDIVLFSCFFAAFAVLRTATAGGPSGAELFEPWRVAVQTAFLLASSFTCGMAAVATRARSHLWTQVGLFVTGLLGLGFLLLEAQEFASMILGGNGPDRSAFLSSFFALVGLHGLHVTVGLLWLGTMMAQVYFKSFQEKILGRLLCFNLFWHTLDIIWVAIFTVVYLIGVRPMSDHSREADPNVEDVAPGLVDEEDYTVREGILGYVVGLVLATLLTGVSFYVAKSDLFWQPSLPIALVVLAIAQMAVHLIFFIHITTAPDNTNNILALAFGVLIVTLVVVGSLWIMYNLNHNLMPADQMMQMQR